MKKDDCIFCKIIEGLIPSYKIYEDEDVFGMLTIRPHVKGHIILLPKNHSEETIEMDDETFTKLFAAGKKLGIKIKEIFNPPRVSFLTMGFGVAHTHLHILPINHETDLNTEKAYEASPEELSETQKLFV